MKTLGTLIRNLRKERKLPLREVAGFLDMDQAILSKIERGPGSDIDIAIEADDSFSYFDLAEIQHQIEQAVNRSVDIGFIDSFKPHIRMHVEQDLKIIFERSAS